jgi:hypothetical protein
MSESLTIDSVFWRRLMSKPYSLDLRERVMESVEAGASRHEAAERFEVSVSSAIRWVQRLSFHAATYNIFNVQRHLISAQTHRAFRASAMQTWCEVTAAA